MTTFEAWKLASFSKRAKIMRESSFHAAIWGIWKERNARCFNGKSIRLEALIDKIKFLVASWISILPIFRGVSVNIIMWDWRDVAAS